MDEIQKVEQTTRNLLLINVVDGALKNFPHDINKLVASYAQEVDSGPPRQHMVYEPEILPAPPDVPIQNYGGYLPLKHRLF